MVANSADLQAMINRASEGQRLEFKVDIPVHPQNAKEQRSKGHVQPRDGWWSNKAISDHGRDRILEEVVAFANAQGGRLVLGMDEDPATTVATAICALPRVVELEARFRACLLSCVEPRLPQIEIHAVETDGIGGGVIVFEIEASRLGPHRVTGTQQVPVRRGDKCVNATMPEIHEMVLRNARRFEDVQRTISSRMSSLEPLLLADLDGRHRNTIIGGSDESRIEGWLKQNSMAAFAFRILLVAHEDLGIARIRTFDHLVPDKRCIGERGSGRPAANIELVGLWPEQRSAHRFLGGVRQSVAWPEGLVEFCVSREGVVELTHLRVGRPERIAVDPETLAGAVGCCFGIYDKLRLVGDRPSIPAELAISFLSRGPVRAAVDATSPEARGGQLPRSAEYPHRTVSDEDDMTRTLNDTVQDFLDSSDTRGAFRKEFVYIRL